MAMLYVRNTECALNKLLWIHTYQCYKDDCDDFFYICNLIYTFIKQQKYKMLLKSTFMTTGASESPTIPHNTIYILTNIYFFPHYPF